ncbi:MAG TPA: LysR family transcriptional regulator [Candidatus Acidoferrales bacterium]|nr:LysR family transcriptional regulator [Candidatus Acidoferrales bacterium]
MLLLQIEGFLEVARLGSVSRAAEALSITQPTLTARLHALETDFDARLFVRTRQGMRLTDCGRALVPYAERCVRAVVDGRRAISEVGRGSSGQLVIAAAPAVSTYLLPALLERFVLEHPKVEVAVRTGHSEDVLQMVLKDEVQLGLGRAMRHPDVELLTFHEEELVLVTAPDHPFAKAGEVEMGELSSEQLIMFDRTSSYFEVTQAALLAAGVTLRGVMELDNIEAAKKMVERDLGVALLPLTAIDVEVSAGTLVRVRLLGAPPMRRSLVAMWRRDAEVHGGLDAFISLLKAFQG